MSTCLRTVIRTGVETISEIVKFLSVTYVCPVNSKKVTAPFDSFTHREAERWSDCTYDKCKVGNCPGCGHDHELTC